ncbi:putative RDD family protein [Oryzomicrobium terrae]|uniref:Putative RDD family protein n=1 Tax=Oryzomicrobium terrae TaxID=1735038 RepID=A0A5C1E5N9_9RHOO|nr:putative RDD family protein [Oryzomicrobium terrae]
MAYESLLLAGVLAVGFITPHLLVGALLHRVASPGLLWAHLFLLLALYFLWFWLHGGQTLAMKTWRVRLEDNRGYPVTPFQALIRYLAAWPSTLLIVGLLWSLIDRDRQFLHDRLAGTRVVALPR